MSLFSPEAEKEAKEAGGGKFVKFDEPQTLVVLGPALNGYAEFDQTSNRMVGCVEGRFRMVALAWTPGDDEFRVIEGPRSLAMALLNIEAAGADLDRVLLEIKRVGAGKKTTYSAKVIRKLTDPELASLAQLVRPDLSVETKWLVEYREKSADTTRDQIPF